LVRVRRTIVITGANSGIGLDAATKLAAMGHNVYVACRCVSYPEE
jgi:protochlorophyllide reductase